MSEAPRTAERPAERPGWHGVVADAVILAVFWLVPFLVDSKMELYWFAAYLQWAAVLPLMLFWLRRGHRRAMKVLLLAAGATTLASMLCGVVMIYRMYG